MFSPAYRRCRLKQQIFQTCNLSPLSHTWFTPPETHPPTNPTASQPACPWSRVWKKWLEENERSEAWKMLVCQAASFQLWSPLNANPRQRSCAFNSYGSVFLKCQLFRMLFNEHTLKWCVRVGEEVAFRCLFLFCYGSTGCSGFISPVGKLPSLPPLLAPPRLIPFNTSLKSSWAYLLHRCDKMRSSS